MLEGAGLILAKRSSFPYAVSVALVALGLGYLGLTGIYGEYGMMRLMTAEAEAEEQKRELRMLEAQQEMLKRDIRALSPETLDLDALEERLRIVLGWAHRDDVLLSPEAAEVASGAGRPNGPTLRFPDASPKEATGAE